MSFNQKHQILASLDRMDQTQMDKVLAYIRGLDKYETREQRNRRFKSEALRQIQNALGGNQVSGF